MSQTKQNAYIGEQISSYRLNDSLFLESLSPLPPPSTNLHLRSTVKAAYRNITPFHFLKMPYNKTDVYVFSFTDFKFKVHK